LRPRQENDRSIHPSIDRSIDDRSAIFRPDSDAEAKPKPILIRILILMHCSHYQLIPSPPRSTGHKQVFWLSGIEERLPKRARRPKRAQPFIFRKPRPASGLLDNGPSPKTENPEAAAGSAARVQTHRCGYTATLPDADAREMRVRYGYEYEYIGVESHANGRGWRRTRAPRVAGSLSPGCYWENPGIGRPNRQWYVLRVLSSLGD